MTVLAYQTLYESSIAYGMRKALMAEQNKDDMASKISGYKHACDELENEVSRQEAEVLEMVSKDQNNRD